MYLLFIKTGAECCGSACTRDGVLRCDPNTGTVTRIPINEPYAEICTFYEDADKLWIGTQNGLFSCQNDKIRREDRINGQLVDPMVHGILRDRQGKLWVGTFGKGFFIFNAENKLVKADRYLRRTDF